MDELIAFVTARLDEDEAAAKAATPGPWEAETFIDDDNPVGVEYLVSAEAHIVVGAGLGHDQAEAETVHIARHDPARALREVAADRALLAELEHAATADFGITGEPYDAGWYGALELAVKIRAAVWSDHPDYRQEWAPEPVR